MSRRSRERRRPDREREKRNESDRKVIRSTLTLAFAPEILSKQADRRDRSRYCAGLSGSGYEASRLFRLSLSTLPLYTVFDLPGQGRPLPSPPPQPHNPKSPRGRCRDRVAGKKKHGDWGQYRGNSPFSIREEWRSRQDQGSWTSTSTSMLVSSIHEDVSD